jgi:hypothetical protein
VIRAIRPNVEQFSRDLLEDLGLPQVDDRLMDDVPPCYRAEVTGALFWKTRSL